MNASTEIRAQLHSLKIPKDQRPASAPARSMRTGTGWLLAVLAVGGVAAGTYGLRDRISDIATSASAAPVPLLTVAATGEAAVSPVLTASGKIVSDHRVAVATKVSGQIVALHFEQGNRVEQGQILARVEETSYQALRDEAAARLAKSRAGLEYQQFNFERISDLYQKETARHIELADARRALREAEAQVAADQAALDHAAKMLADCQVMAPITGVILDRNVEVGDFVAAEGGRAANANALFAVIADMTRMRVEVDVSELDISRLSAGMDCQITPDAYKDRHYTGHVLWIDPGANYSKATVQVKVRIEDPDEYLRVEGSARVVFLDKPAEPEEETDRRLWIPLSACRFDPNGERATVFVAADGRLVETAITTGRRLGDRIEVLSGLDEGQSIAIGSLEQLMNGQRVRS